MFQTPTARISADSVVFNTKTSVGTFNNATGIAQLGERGERNRSMFGTLEPDVYFYGATIEKIGPDKYRITKGGFTTCVQPTPRWEIVSGNATLNLDDYVMLRNAVVEVKDVPVFYLPMLYYPIQEDDRATGSCCRCTARRSPPARRSATRSSGRSIAARTRRSSTTGCSRAATASAPSTATCSGRRRRATSSYYWLDEKEAVINGQHAPAAAEQDDSRRTSARTCPFGLSARGRVDYFTDVTRAADLQPQLLQRLEQHAAAIDGGVSGSWRNLSVERARSSAPNRSHLDDSTVTGPRRRASPRR